MRLGSICTVGTIAFCIIIPTCNVSCSFLDALQLGMQCRRDDLQFYTHIPTGYRTHKQNKSEPRSEPCPRSRVRQELLSTDLFPGGLNASLASRSCRGETTEDRSRACYALCWLCERAAQNKKGPVHDTWQTVRMLGWEKIHHCGLAHLAFVW